MKKILFFAVAIITIVSTSCTDQQKTKIYVKRYLGDDVKVTDFFYNETDTIYTYDDKFELVKLSEKLRKEAEHDLRMTDIYSSFGNHIKSLNYSSNAVVKMTQAAETRKAAYDISPKQNIVTTATVVYKDKAGKYKTEKFVISTSHTVSESVENIGMSKKVYDDKVSELLNK